LKHPEQVGLQKSKSRLAVIRGWEEGRVGKMTANRLLWGWQKCLK
jgi:hypothetical protein